MAKKQKELTYVLGDVEYTKDSFSELKKALSHLTLEGLGAFLDDNDLAVSDLGDISMSTWRRKMEDEARREVVIGYVRESFGIEEDDDDDTPNDDEQTNEAAELREDYNNDPDSVELEDIISLLDSLNAVELFTDAFSEEEMEEMAMPDLLTYIEEVWDIYTDDSLSPRKIKSMHEAALDRLGATLVSEDDEGKSTSAKPKGKAKGKGEYEAEVDSEIGSDDDDEDGPISGGERVYPPNNPDKPILRILHPECLNCSWLNPRGLTVYNCGNDPDCTAVRAGMIFGRDPENLAQALAEIFKNNYHLSTEPNVKKDVDDVMRLVNKNPALTPSIIARAYELVALSGGIGSSSVPA